MSVTAMQFHSFDFVTMKEVFLSMCIHNSTWPASLTSRCHRIT